MLEHYGLIPIIMAVMLQSGALFYWGGKISKAVERLELSANKHDGRIRKLEFGFDADD